MFTYSMTTAFLDYIYDVCCFISFYENVMHTPFGDLYWFAPLAALCFSS